MKKYFFVILVLTVSFSLFACSINHGTTTTSTTISTTSSMQIYEYSMFFNQMVFDPDMQLNLSDDPYYIYYYGITCAHCAAIKQTVLSVFAELQNDQVFLVETNYKSDIMTGINVTSTPSLVYVVNHKVVDIYAGQTDVVNKVITLT